MSSRVSQEFLVLGQRGDRLTCRMEGLLAVWRFARTLQRKTVIYWPPRQDDAYLCSSILDLPAMAEDPASQDLSIREETHVFSDDVLDLGKSPGWPYRLDRDSLCDLRCDFLIRKDFDFRCRDEKRIRLREAKRQLYQLLRPHPVVRSQLKLALDWAGTGEFIAVHLRRGDMLTDTEQLIRRYVTLTSSTKPVLPKQIAQVEAKLEKIIGDFVWRTAPVEAYLDAVRFASLFRRKRPLLIIFSDTKASAMEFQELCRGYPTLLMSDFVADLTEIQRAWLEVLVMTRSLRIISTGSAYGKFGSRYGGVPFTDVRYFTTQKKIHAFFRKSFAAELEKSPEVRVKCERLIDDRMGWSTILKFLTGRLSEL